MASPTQMVVGKGISNMLTAEGLLKILRDLILLIPFQNRFPILVHRMVGPHKVIFISLAK